MKEGVNVSECLDLMIVELLENGCSKDIVDQFCQLSNGNNKIDLILILRKYRQELINRIDTNGKLIDCIDYLIYDLERTL